MRFGEVSPSPGTVLSLSLAPAEAAVRLPSRDQDTGAMPTLHPPVLSGKEETHMRTEISHFILYQNLAWFSGTWLLHPAGSMSHKLSPEVTNTAPRTIKLHILQHIILSGFGKAKHLCCRRGRNYDELFPDGLIVIVARIKSSLRL